MSKYSTVSHQKVATSPRPHPVWRGIGCLLILIVPLISYALSVLTINLALAQQWPIPYQLMGYPIMPDLLWQATPGLAPILAFIQSQNNLYAILALTGVYVVFFGALVSFGYALLYRFVGPPRYGPQDAPPPNIRVRTYKR